MIELEPDLPGAELVAQGLCDLEQGVETIASLLVSMSAPRLRAAGLPVGTVFEEPELRLYRRLAALHGDNAHSRYNALVRQVVSFQRAARCAK